MTGRTFSSPLSPGAFRDAVASRVKKGARFAGLFASALGSETRLVAALAEGSAIACEQTTLATPLDHYPSLTSDVPAARWYEREIHDLFGSQSTSGSELDPLIFAFEPNAPRPRMGSGPGITEASIDLSPLPLNLRGEGVFSISYGPVRSGVFESIEYVIETPGEDIPHVGTRVSYKHRGVESRFEGMDIDDGVLLAERCEGVASVAHALAFCGAVEDIGGIVVSSQAGLVRVLHAELERVANHLDSTIRHTEAAGQAVAYARFSFHKERVQRLRAQLCGSRFGRGVVVPGGVSAPPALGAGQMRSSIGSLARAIDADTRLLMSTPSFLDRLRGTGVLSEVKAAEYGALGPVARGSGLREDVRSSRPYAAYDALGEQRLSLRTEGDALSRQRVRIAEIEGAFRLVADCVDRLETLGEPEGLHWAQRIEQLDGEALGWAEAPQGEVLTWVVIREGKLTRVKPRSASFHNLALFPAAFPNDVLTDFAFIEASFGLSIAGVAN